MKTLIVSLLVVSSLFGCELGPTVDAGVTPATDAGPVDAGEADAGVQDAGPPALSFRSSDGGAVTSVRLDDWVAVRGEALTPGSQVSLTATMGDWTSQAVFVVAADGTIDTGRDSPVSGSYEGVDADGLFWSMNVQRFSYAPSADVTVTATTGTAAPLTATLRRSSDVRGARLVTPPTPTGIVGKLVLPAGSGPFALIIAFGGSEGGLSGGYSYATELVPQGYAVLALAYFGMTGVPSDLNEVPLEYFDRALAWAKTQPEVDATRLGVIGGSRGGELSLLLASRLREVKAAVADVPSGYVWGGLSPGTHAWTVDGGALPEIPSSGAQPDVITTALGPAYVFTPMFRADVAAASPAQREAARIRVEESSAAIALFAGGDDQLWPSCELAQVAMDKLQSSGHAQTHPDEFHCYPNAGHDLHNVGLPTTWSNVARYSATELLALGGTPKGAAHAARDRQGRVRAFFARTLQP